MGQLGIARGSHLHPPYVCRRPQVAVWGRVLSRRWHSEHPRVLPGPAHLPAPRCQAAPGTCGEGRAISWGGTTLGGPVRAQEGSQLSCDPSAAAPITPRSPSMTPLPTKPISQRKASCPPKMNNSGAKAPKLQRFGTKHPSGILHPEPGDHEGSRGWGGYHQHPEFLGSPLALRGPCVTPPP